MSACPWCDFSAGHDPMCIGNPDRYLGSDAKIQAEIERSREATLQARFEEFDRENPEVYRELRALALEAVGRGVSRLGIGMLFEVLRWQRTLRARRELDEFKLNNSFRSRYARMIMEREPKLAGLFETRVLLSEEEGERNG